ncbi:hypothetical protein T07_4888 [Trichinella nelsoni]|uniref:Uncharacterized protein n=1 Tax=Trichinella nelsoni TaxID=6336 RepID=A0A0V0RKL7_9BILA|nr:hypothetical protein T07_4888 [Trichinella nelsoni]
MKISHSQLNVTSRQMRTRGSDELEKRNETSFTVLVNRCKISIISSRAAVVRNKRQKKRRLFSAKVLSQYC